MQEATSYMQRRCEDSVTVDFKELMCDYLNGFVWLRRRYDGWTLWTDPSGSKKYEEFLAR
jgi:hypothetical protein